MATVGAYEAKTNLAALLERAAAGEHITITKHGRPLARLLPADDSASPVESTIAAILAARADATLAGASLRELIEEGRRS